MSPTPFLITALPRSGTAWLANFLTHGAVHCEHELSGSGRGPAEILQQARRAAALTGTHIAHWGVADTSLALMLPEMLALAPTARVAVIRRPEADVARSLRRLGLPHAEAVTRYVAKHLDRACRMPGALILDYEDLTDGEALSALLQHVAAGEPFNVARWRLLRRFNVQLTGEEFEGHTKEGQATAEANLTRALQTN